MPSRTSASDSPRIIPSTCAGRRADRHAQADLARAPQHGVRHQTVEPDAGQGQRDQAEEAGQAREQLLLAVQPIDLLVLRAQVQHRQRRVDVADGGADGGEDDAPPDRPPAQTDREVRVAVEPLEAPGGRWSAGVTPRSSVYFASPATPTISTCD